MKSRSLALVVALFVGVSSLALPATSYAGHHGGGDAWAWAFGGLAGGLLLGTAIARPYYYPAPVYAYPPPPVVYTYPAPAPVYVPNQAYACPDPAYTSRSYSQAPAYNGSPSSSRNPNGQWVQVPGQWVGDRWVPSHRAWAPANQ